MKQLQFLILFLSFNGYSQKKALIFGITGQDGSYLTELLLEKGYKVHGVKRRSSSFNTCRLEDIFKNKNLKLHYGDLSDSMNVTRLIHEVQPDEIYNLGAQSHVRVSFDKPLYTSDIDGLGAMRILEAIRFLGLEKKTKYYQASSSEMFGLVQEVPQKETTPFYPRSPYAVAKVYAYWATVNYREAYGIFACNGILFNHESPRRGCTFVTRKVTRHVAKVAKGSNDILYLGNLNAKRDWGHAKDYMNAAWLMLQQEKPDDYVVATGETHTVREFVELAYDHIGIKIAWRGQGLGEEGYDINSKKILVKIKEIYFRPSEVDLLIGDYSKAKKVLGWKPNYNFESLIKHMVEEDIKN